MKILVADKLSDAGLNWLRAQDDVEVEVRPGLSPEELAEIVVGFDGMIIRSGAKVTATVLAEPGNLRAIARAGVGVDNVDVPVATRKGVLVMNAPGGNTLSTAELTLTLLLSLSRNVAPANASLRAGEWNRKAFQGTQLAGKTLGVVGLGRIGRAVAKRAAGFEMRVLGYDPFFVGKGLDDVEIVKDLIELCKRADYVTVHTPRTDKTVGLIGREELAAMKPTARVVNAARGGIVDPDALREAIEGERIAGAALDVYTSEPPQSEAEKALLQHPRVLAVPHLGASTEEAQEQVALDAAKELVTALRGGEVRNALNAPGFDRALPEALRPYTELAGRMGAVLACITPGAIRRVEVVYRGRISGMNVSPLTTHLLVGLLAGQMDQDVNVVNAPVLAEERGLEVEQITSGKVKEFANLVQVSVHSDERTRTAVGTIFGSKFPRIIAVDGFRMEIKPEGAVVIIFNDRDMPGMVGRVGSIFGQRGVNIADMSFSRKKTGRTVLGVNLDSPPGEDVLDEIRRLEWVQSVCALELPPLPET